MCSLSCDIKQRKKIFPVQNNRFVPMKNPRKYFKFKMTKYAFGRIHILHGFKGGKIRIHNTHYSKSNSKGILFKQELMC